MMQKGEQDIVMNTGPHLGDFNGRISIPELIEAIETMSALCMAGRFWSESIECIRGIKLGIKGNLL